MVGSSLGSKHASCDGAHGGVLRFPFCARFRFCAAKNHPCYGSNTGFSRFSGVSRTATASSHTPKCAQENSLQDGKIKEIVVAEKIEISNLKWFFADVSSF